MKGDICSTFYPSDQIPSQERLVHDFHAYLAVYRELVALHKGRTLETLVSEATEAWWVIEPVRSEGMELPFSDDEDVELLASECSDPPGILPGWESHSGTRAHKVDYAAKQERDAKIGYLGEKAVVNMEIARLNSMGLSKLANMVEHTSEVQGDGLGYDVRSFNKDGSELFIEVKTTTSGKATRFFLSANEIKFSKQNPNNYKLVRLYDFKKHGHCGNYVIEGDLELHCRFTPIQFVVTSVNS